MGINMQKLNINITTEFIKLDQLLKFSGIAENGADAKAMVQEGIVAFNDEPCAMRGKKVREGDKVTVEFEDETVEIHVGRE
jgi:ribosome-associated protein